MLTDEATRRLVIPNFLRIPKFIIIANIMGLLENWLTLLPGIFCPIKKDNKLSNIYYKNIAYSSMTVFSEFDAFVREKNFCNYDNTANSCAIHFFLSVLSFARLTGTSLKATFH